MNLRGMFYPIPRALKLVFLGDFRLRPLVNCDVVKHARMALKIGVHSPFGPKSTMEMGFILTEKCLGRPGA